MTRVVVDVNDETLENPVELGKVIHAACEQIINNGIRNYLTADTCDEAVLDDVVPYDPKLEGHPVTRRRKRKK